jgi:hypothetical protein
LAIERKTLSTNFLSQLSIFTHLGINPIARKDMRANPIGHLEVKECGAKYGERRVTNTNV